ncbi:dehydrogenase [Halostagnicola bangensis]
MTFESHLEDLPEDAPWDEKPGESEVEQYDTDQIPEVDITEEDLRESRENPENWLLYGNDYQNRRHVTADIITRDNVEDLELEYRLEPGDETNDFQGSPLIIHGDPPIMYFTIGPDMLYAINARTGDLLWTHFYEPYVGASDETPSAERGPVVLGDTIYKSTLDLGVLAIDRYTGEEEWYYNGAAVYRGEVADNLMHEELQWERSRGTTSSWPPLIYDGLLMKGSFGGEFGVSGFFDAIDLEGNPEWRVNMTPEHEWVGDSWMHGGGTAWPLGAIEPDEGTIIVPSANPGPWYGTVRPGFNPYTAGKVAIDIETGEHEWHYQDAPHDWWDYDSSAPPLVFEEELDGETTQFATWPSKTGWVFTVNMETGQLHQRSEEYVQHLNTFSLPPYDDLESAPWIMPELAGGTNPYPAGYDPETRTMIVKGFNRPMRFSWFEVEYEPGENYIGMDTIRAELPGDADVEEPDDPVHEGEVVEDPDDEVDDEEEEEEEEDEEEDVDDELTEPPEEWNGHPGAIAGIDPLTGELKWREWTAPGDPPPRGGALTTPTGVTFAGIATGLMIAYDTETGDQLAQLEVGPHGVDGAPISWYDPGEGKQFVAITGGGGTHTDAEDGNTLAVFSLEE